MERVLIDRNEILDILDDRFGFWEYARDVISRNGLDEYEDAMLDLCDDILDGFKNFAESAEVIEERVETTLHISEYYEDYGDYSRPYYLYCCGSCFENVRQDYPDENFKFCPYCGAQYTERKIYEENK